MERITLIPERFDPETGSGSIVDQHILAICDGGRSERDGTLAHFIGKFGSADKSIYSLNCEHLQDVVLGLRVKSELSDPMSVLLTVAQNRFLLNSVKGDGLLNMRLTDDEVKELAAIDQSGDLFDGCIQSQACIMQGTGKPGEFRCSTHSTAFLPPLLQQSPLWTRLLDGLKFFGVQEENLSAITAFRLSMVQRPRFTAQLFPATATTPGTFGCLLGDAANAVHFWPGRGLNSGLASAISLALCLKRAWQGKPLRDSDFLLHEAAMSMLQYRHKSQAWRFMVSTDQNGVSAAIKEKIRQGSNEQLCDAPDRDQDINELLTRLQQIRSRLESRLSGLPEDSCLSEHLGKLSSQTLRTLVRSGAWDALSVGGKEVDVDTLFEE